MATLEQLHRALINADAAGDVEAARTLAAAIRQQQATEQAPVKEVSVAPGEPPLSYGDKLMRKASMFTRGANPVLAGAVAGGALGSLGGPVTAGLGAIGGGLAGPLLKPLTDRFSAGAPESAGERMLEAAGGAMAGAGTQLPAFARIATNTAAPVLRGVSETMSRGPVAQMAAAGPSAAASQWTTEKTDNQILGMLAGIGTGAAFGAGASALSKKSTGPSLQQLREQADDLYKQAREAGVVVGGTKLKSTLAGIADDVGRAGYDADLHPRVAAVLKRLGAEEGAKSLDDIDLLRRVASNAAASNQPDERRIARLVIDKMDDMVDGLTDADLVSGDISKAGPALSAARETWRRVKKAEIINAALEKAQTDAGAKYTQAGLEHSLRTRFKQIANNQKLFRSFNQEEQEAILGIARGSIAQNTLRGLGKFAPHGILSATLGGGAGFALGGPAGAVGLPLAGLAAEQAATRMGMNRFNSLSELIRGAQARPPGLMAPLTIRGLLSAQ